MANEKQQPGADTEQARLKKEEQARRGRRRSRQVIGFALALLILVGAVSIVRSGIEVVGRLMDNTDEMESYNRRIAPLVWYDPLPFESLDKADENLLKSACIWGLLDQRREAGEPFEQNADGDTLVPAAMLDRYAAALFGPDFRFSPQEEEIFHDERQVMDYMYDAETQVYYIPPTSLTPSYISTIVEMNRESGGVLRVTVGYVATRGSDDRIVDTPDIENPERYMDYLFRRDGSEYYLYALETNTEYTPKRTSSAAVASVPSASAGEDESREPDSAPAAEPPEGPSSVSSGREDEQSAPESASVSG